MLEGLARALPVDRLQCWGQCGVPAHGEGDGLMVFPEEQTRRGSDRAPGVRKRADMVGQVLHGAMTSSGVPLVTDAAAAPGTVSGVLTVTVVVVLLLVGVVGGYLLRRRRMR